MTNTTTWKPGCCVERGCTDETCMRLPPGRTCGDCRHRLRCSGIIGTTDDRTYCDFFLRRFVDAEKVKP